EARLATARDIDRPSLVRRRNEQIVRRLEVETRITKEMYDDAINAEREAYAAMRGRAGALEANARAREVHRLTDQAAAIRTIAEQCADNGLIAREKAVALEVTFETLPIIKLSSGMELHPTSPKQLERFASNTAGGTPERFVQLSGRRVGTKL